MFSVNSVEPREIAIITLKCSHLTLGRSKWCINFASKDRMSYQFTTRVVLFSRFDEAQTAFSHVANKLLPQRHVASLIWRLGREGLTCLGVLRRRRRRWPPSCSVVANLIQAGMGSTHTFPADCMPIVTLRALRKQTSAKHDSALNRQPSHSRSQCRNDSDS